MRLKETNKETVLKRAVRSLLIELKNATRDFGLFVKPRQGFAADIRMAREFIMSVADFGPVRAVVTIGGGHLENPYYLAKDLGAEEIIAFDPVAKPAKYIEKDIIVNFYQEKFEDITQQEIGLLERTDFIWEMSNVLQTMPIEEKEGLLNKIWQLSKPGQLMVFVDEEPSDSAEDSHLNLLYNPEQKMFDRLTFEEYESLFKRTGFKISKIERHYHRDLDIMILEVVERPTMQ